MNDDTPHTDQPPEPPPPPEQETYDQPPVLSSDEKTWGMLSHILTLVGFIIPFGNILAPLIIYLTKKDTMPFTTDQAKESLNFQITLSIVAIINIPLCFLCIGLIILPILIIVWIVFVIMAGLKANAGIAYRYPFALRLVK